VLRRGQVISEAPPARATLHLPGRPATVDFRLQRVETDKCDYTGSFSKSSFYCAP
jgi:hypothetical protein